MGVIPNPKMAFIFPISCILALIFPILIRYFPKCVGKGSFPKSQIKSLGHNNVAYMWQNLEICMPKTCQVKPVLSNHSKIDKTKVFKTNGSLMKGNILQNAPLGAFCNTFDLH